MATEPEKSTNHSWGEFLRIKGSSWIPRRHKWELRSLLLNVDDVPPEEFNMRENRSWPTAMWVKTDDEITSRLREIGSLTVWRSMENSQSRRVLAVHLIPFATHADAETSMTSNMSQHRTMPLAPPMDRKTVTLENVAFEGVSMYVAHELTPTDPSRIFGLLTLSGIHDTFRFGMSFGSRGEMWTWDEAIPLVERQTEKISAGTQESS